METIALTNWQAAGLALMCVIVGAVVAAYFKPDAKTPPDSKRRKDG